MVRLAVGWIGEKDESVNSVAQFGRQVEEAEWLVRSRWEDVFGWSLLSVFRYGKGVYEVVVPRHHDRG